MNMSKRETAQQKITTLLTVVVIPFHAAIPLERSVRLLIIMLKAPMVVILESKALLHANPKNKKIHVKFPGLLEYL